MCMVFIESIILLIQRNKLKSDKNRIIANYSWFTRLIIVIIFTLIFYQIFQEQEDLKWFEFGLGLLLAQSLAHIYCYFKYNRKVKSIKK